MKVFMSICVVAFFFYSIMVRLLKACVFVPFQQCNQKSPMERVRNRNGLVSSSYRDTDELGACAHNIKQELRLCKFTLLSNKIICIFCDVVVVFYSFIQLFARSCTVAKCKRKNFSIFIPFHLSCKMLAKPKSGWCLLINIETILK